MVNLTLGARSDASVTKSDGDETRDGSQPKGQRPALRAEGARGSPQRRDPVGRSVQSAAPQAGGGSPPTTAQLFCLSVFCYFLVYFISLFCVSVPHPPSPPFSVCVCLWPAGPPLRCSSASSTPPEQSPSPPPSPPANEGPGRLLGNGAAQPAADSDSEEEFVPNSFLVKSGSGNLCVAANGE